jgi:hypothetical protein
VYDVFGVQKLQAARHILQQQQQPQQVLLIGLRLPVSCYTSQRAPAHSKRQQRAEEIMMSAGPLC